MIYPPFPHGYPPCPAREISIAMIAIAAFGIGMIGGYILGSREKDENSGSGQEG